jgi:hypothetical protein
MKSTLQSAFCAIGLALALTTAATSSFADFINLDTDHVKCNGFKIDSNTKVDQINRKCTLSNSSASVKNSGRNKVSKSVSFKSDKDGVITCDVDGDSIQRCTNKK